MVMVAMVMVAMVMEAPVAADTRGGEVRVPKGWSRATAPLAPELLDPHEILSMGTFRLDELGAVDRAPCVGNAPPASALAAMGRDDVFIWIVEWDQLASTSTRRPSDLAPALEPRSCVRARHPDLKGRSLLFTANGRTIEAHLVVGDGASRKRRRQASALLDRLDFDALAPSAAT
jgi:hypothetical protein